MKMVQSLTTQRESEDSSDEGIDLESRDEFNDPAIRYIWVRYRSDGSHVYF
jgi:hypothetical protein